MESDAASMEGAVETKLADGEGKEMKPEASDRNYEGGEANGANGEVESRPLMRKHFKVEVEDSDEELGGRVLHEDGGDQALPRIRLRRMAEGEWAVETEDREWNDGGRVFPRGTSGSEREAVGDAARRQRRHTSYIQEGQFGGIVKFHKPEEDECSPPCSRLRRKVKQKRRRGVPAGPLKTESFGLPLSLSPLSLNSPHHSSPEDPLSSEPQNWRRMGRERKMVEIRKCDPFVYSSSEAMGKPQSVPQHSGPDVARKPSDQHASASKSHPCSQASPYVFNFTGDHSVSLGYKDGGEYMNYSGAMPSSYTYRCLMEPSGTQGRLVLEPCGPVPLNCPPSAPLGAFAGLRGDMDVQGKKDPQQSGQGSSHAGSAHSSVSSHPLGSVHTDRKPKRLRLVVTDGSVDLDLQYTD
ncbi:hypothetical protein COCON_G00202380 [Conger conger]|uniref:Uncharacterized protein n=1 Tax=Conger conger TaxID=82655 RepID=A0A9Q1HPY1_CONCO|nr:hypothetical protein COCON_G00202380 [Conger conger]